MSTRYHSQWNLGLAVSVSAGESWQEEMEIKPPEPCALSWRESENESNSNFAWNTGCVTISREICFSWVYRVTGNILVPFLSDVAFTFVWGEYILGYS